jgi:ADP-ribose pyrophosphatase
MATRRIPRNLPEARRMTKGRITTMSFPRNNDRLLFTASRFRVVERKQPMPDGRTVTRQVVLHPGAVVIVPMVDASHVCLIRNERVAVEKTLVELPAGTLELPEPPYLCAVRELREETGYAAVQWHELPGFYMSPGILCERMHVFVAEDLTAGDPAREAGEQIDNLVVSWDDALAMIDRGEIEDAKTIAALLAWDRRRRIAGP